MNLFISFYFFFRLAYIIYAAILVRIALLLYTTQRRGCVIVLRADFDKLVEEDIVKATWVPLGLRLRLTPDGKVEATNTGATDVRFLI